MLKFKSVKVPKGELNFFQRYIPMILNKCEIISIESHQFKLVFSVNSHSERRDEDKREKGERAKKLKALKIKLKPPRIVTNKSFANAKHAKRDKDFTKIR